MDKDVLRQRKVDLEARLETLKFALGNPGANLDPLLTDEGKKAVKALKRQDLESQVARIRGELAVM